jgi:hypothetical protein
MMNIRLRAGSVATHPGTVATQKAAAGWMQWQRLFHI